MKRLNSTIQYKTEEISKKVKQEVLFISPRSFVILVLLITSWRALIIKLELELHESKVMIENSVGFD